jgi:hypothetical protein
MRRLLVRATAERIAYGWRARAPPDGGFFRQHAFHGLPASALVRAIAERLVGGTPAGTPPVDAWFDCECEWLFIADVEIFRPHSSLADTLEMSHEEMGRKPYFTAAISGAPSLSSEISGSLVFGGRSFLADSGTEPRPRLG